MNSGRLCIQLDCGCDVDDEITKDVPLRPLTSLKWPYVPEESAYPDPLKRDDPKPLQTAQYEAIGSRNLHLSYLAVSNQTPKPGVPDGFFIFIFIFI